MRGILVDTSVWLAGFFEEHECFSRSRAFLASGSAAEPALFCRATEQSWLRLATTPALHKLYKVAPITNSDAAETLGVWLSRPGIGRLEEEPEGTRELWLELASIPSASPKVWMDAYLAALAIRAGLPFATLDADFHRFESAGLKVRHLAA